MDFALLPPEVNSGRIYAGPGSSPMLAAAAGWDSLAAEAVITAQAYENVLLDLATSHWRGPSSLSLQGAAAIYISWLRVTGDQAAQTAVQARAAAAAFEQARAMTVPPVAVAANRIRLCTLLSTNVLGQNTAAIAATEAEYVEMWAQDAAAMFAYAASSAVAAQLSPFEPPAQTTNPAGLAAQTAAVAEAGLSQAAESVVGLLDELPLEGIDAMDAIYSALVGLQTCQSLVVGVVQTGKSTGLTAAVPAAAAQSALPLTSAVNTLRAAPASAVATLGAANRIGPLAVPSSWAAPSGGPGAASLATGLTTLPGADELAESRGGMPGVPFVSGPSTRASGVVPRYGVRLTVMPRPLAAG